MVTEATGKEATLNEEKIKARECNDLSKATFLSTEVPTFYSQGLGRPFEELLAAARLHRTGGGAYGHMMGATRPAEIMIDPNLSIWDAARHFPVPQEARGFCIDFNCGEN